MAKEPLTLILDSDQLQSLGAGKPLAPSTSEGLSIVVHLKKDLRPFVPESLARVPTHPSSAEKVDLFASLFVGRSDVFANRWENKAGKSGYSPACDNIWKPGVCQLPKMKCSDCAFRKYSPLTSGVFESHLRGEKVVGIYPLLPDNTCWFLAFDCDGSQWS